MGKEAPTFGKQAPVPTPGGGTQETPTHPPTNHLNQHAPLKVGANRFLDHFGSLRKTATPCRNTMSIVECIVIPCSPHTQSSSLEDGTRSALSSISQDWDFHVDLSQGGKWLQGNGCRSARVIYCLFCC